MKPPAAVLCALLCSILLAGVALAATDLSGHRGEAGLSVVVGPVPGVRFTRLAAAADDLYVIDAAGQRVRRYILHGQPAAQLFAEVLRWKEGADKIVIGQPVDMVMRGDRLLILDSLDSLWSYAGSTYQKGIVPLRVESDQGTLAGLAIHGTDLLVLDATHGAIWRYRPDAAGSYDDVPVRLGLPPSTVRPALIAIAAGRRAFFELKRDGSLLAIPWQRPEAARHLTLSSAIRAFWGDDLHDGILVALDGQVVALTLQGTVTWRQSFQLPRGEAANGLAVSPRGVVYLLTPNNILRLAKRAPAHF